MGLWDQYDSVTKETLEGWKGNIMGSYGGKVWEANIDYILEKTKDGRVFLYDDNYDRAVDEWTYAPPEPRKSDGCKK